VNTVVDSALLDDVVRLIVDAVKPVRIILFGSAARGQMNENSDLDLLIIMPDGTHRRNTGRTVYRALAELDLSKDVIVVTEDDVRKYRDEPSLVICPALREGREIYRAS
jgi:predicted nucleotidyltransferase